MQVREQNYNASSLQRRVIVSMLLIIHNLLLTPSEASDNGRHLFLFTVSMDDNESESDALLPKQP